MLLEIPSYPSACQYCFKEGVPGLQETTILLLLSFSCTGTEGVLHEHRTQPTNRGGTAHHQRRAVFRLFRPNILELESQSCVSDHQERCCTCVLPQLPLQPTWHYLYLLTESCFLIPAQQLKFLLLIDLTTHAVPTRCPPQGNHSQVIRRDL